MKSLSILIVEDEILIANLIKLYLEERGHCVTAIAISYEEAITQYTLNRPDLVLLDIRLYGEKSGIDFSKFLLNSEDAIPYIFLTSQYDKDVVDKALENKPNGYLTKPIVKETLWTTIESAIKLHTKDTKTTAITKIAIHDGKHNHQISPEEILYIKADHVYNNIHFVNGKVITLRGTLKDIIQKLDCNALILCHRSYIVNKNYISKWTSNHFILRNSLKIPVSRSRKEEVFNLVKLN